MIAAAVGAGRMGLEWEGCCPAKPWHHGGVDSRRYIPFDLVVMSQARRPADRMLWRDGQIICSSGVRIDSPLAAVAREMQLSCECKRYRPKRGAARVQYARESGLPQHWSGKKRRYSDARARRCSRVQEEEGGDAEAAQGGPRCSQQVRSEGGAGEWPYVVEKSMPFRTAGCVQTPGAIWRGAQRQGLRNAARVTSNVR